MSTIIRTLRPVESFGCSFPSPGTLASVPDAAAASLIAAGVAEALESEVSTSLYAAHSVLAATADNSPAPVTLAEGTLLGRATGGNVAALTAAEAGNLLGSLPVQSDILSGESNISRAVAAGSAGQISTGILYLVYFTARKTEPVVSLRVGTNTTAAAATPTLCKMGFYSVASPYNETSDLTLLGATANDTTLFSAASTMYTRALTAPASKVAGQRYAIGVLVVSGATMPSLQGVASSGAASLEWSVAPILTSYITGQSDLASITDSLTVPSARLFYAATLPS